MRASITHAKTKVFVSMKVTAINANASQDSLGRTAKKVCKNGLGLLLMYFIYTLYTCKGQCPLAHTVIALFKKSFHANSQFSRIF